ncbi:MAG: NADH-quinone oxidoreductase subunit C [Planctomycetes bacterium]|nr:NADH-quinone oxidoreductase subunit C [Planctomycetota bacterium]
MTDAAKPAAPAAPEKKLPPTHDKPTKTARVLEENQLDHDLLKGKLAGKFSEIVTEFKQTIIKSDRANVVEALRILKHDPDLMFNMIVDVTAVDNMRRPDFEPERRFTMIYIVYSASKFKRVRLTADVPESDPRVPTAGGVYHGATWIEREVYDMFGIEFDGHPDLRRVLLPDYYEHFPLRKDYPLTGRGERDNFVRAEELE